MTAFILPSSPFSVKEVDSSYEEEFNLLKNEGFKVYLMNIDELDTTKIYPKYEEEKLIYRGWMLSEENYQKLNNKVNSRNTIKSQNLVQLINFFFKVNKNV